MCNGFLYDFQILPTAPLHVADPLQDDRIYDESFQSRAEKLTEELAEAIDDEAALARDYEQLAVEKLRAEESLVELEDSKAAMLDEIHELVTKNDRLEQELKDASDSLEEAEDDRATLVRNVDKLNSERARLEGALTDAQEILHRISSFSYSIRPTATEPSSGDCDANAKANAYADTETETWSVGVLTLASSVQVTPRWSGFALAWGVSAAYGTKYKTRPSRGLNHKLVH